eukprot:4874991-Prymnesium_polylepis.1
MAPKGASPAKGAGKGGKKAADAPMTKDDGDDDAAATYESGASAFIPEGPTPTNREECFAAFNFEDLPNRSVWEEVVLNMLRDKFLKIVNVFTHYCKQGSDCASVETASRLKLGAQHARRPPPPGIDRHPVVFGTIARARAAGRWLLRGIGCRLRRGIGCCSSAALAETPLPAGALAR